MTQLFIRFLSSRACMSQICDVCLSDCFELNFIRFDGVKLGPELKTCGKPSSEGSLSNLRTLKS